VNVINVVQMYFGSLDQKDPTRLKESIRNTMDQSSTSSRLACIMNDAFNNAAYGVKPAGKERLPVFEAICPSDGHNESLEEADES
jgi:hypothetical protein